MWQEGQEDLFDDVPESFLRCALHQEKIIRERWKFWSGKVPADVSIRLHRLESILSINEEKKSTDQRSTTPCQPVRAEIRNYPKIERFYIEPEHNIIIQGPDLRRMVEIQKRRVHFWCCH